MQLTLSSALAAFLVTGDVLVSAACPPPVNRHRPSSSGALPSFPWPTGAFTFPGSGSYSTAVSLPVPSATSTTLATVVVPTTTSSSSSSSSEVPTVVPTTSSTSTSTAAAVTSSAATSSNSALTADQQSALDTQNSARADVGEADLAWDAGLVTDAQTWADHLAAQNSPGSLVHDTSSGEGENLYWQSNADSPFENAAAAWVAEKSSYSGEAIGTGSGFESYGHYSMS